MLRTSVTADHLDAPSVVTAYKQLAHVERDFRHIKADELALRPIHHRLEDRVRAHVLICMLAAYLVWHLRAALAPLTYTDTQPHSRANPVAPTTRSTTATRKASRHRDETDQPVRSFRTLLTHLGTLTRNRIHIAGTEFDQLTEPTPTQRRAFRVPRRFRTVDLIEFTSGMEGMACRSVVGSFPRSFGRKRSRR